jgi:acetyl esterase/lipase
VVLLRPNAKVDASAPPEGVEERGKNGVVDRSITNVSQPSLTVYLPPTDKATGTGIVIAPGGGYQHLAIDKEGHDIARWLTTQGVAGFVLKYRLPGQGVLRKLPTGSALSEVKDAIHVALEDAEDSVRLVRARAAEWHVKPDAVGFMGFSAGGHLGAMMGMVARDHARPNFLVLGYPAIPQTLQVTPATPHTFLVAAADDPTVNASQNAGRFFEELRKAKVSAELHIYSSGGHGFGMNRTGKTSAAWPDAFLRWLKSEGL